MDKEKMEEVLINIKQLILATSVHLSSAKATLKLATDEIDKVLSAEPEEEKKEGRTITVDAPRTTVFLKDYGK